MLAFDISSTSSKQPSKANVSWLRWLKCYLHVNDVHALMRDRTIHLKFWEEEHVQI
jgi:hypothetical protein